MAQVEQINVRVGNVTSAVSFNLAHASLKQLEGVSSVSADMKSGRIDISTRPGVSVRNVMDRLRIAGFERGNDLEIIVRGKLERRGNRIVLVAPGQNELFIVEANTKSQMAANLAEQQSKARIVAGLSGSGNQFSLTVRQMQKN